MAAFEAAIEDGADWIETDLRRTADGVIVLVHDLMVPGTPPAPVRALSFEELQHRYQAAGRAPVDRFDEMVGRLAGRVGMDIEIKVPGFEGEVISTLREQAPEGSYLISSFDERVLRAVHGISPGVPTAPILYAHGLGGRLLGKGRGPRALLRYAASSAFVLFFSLARSSWVSEARRAAVPLHFWTVNHPALGLRLARAGAWSLITDCPGPLRQAFEA